ncbi:hypothetical protein Q7P35_009687 [Cladosporium inversicolor]
MGLCHGRPWEPPKSSFVVPSMELTQTTDRTCIDFKVTTVCWEESNPGTWKIDPAITSNHHHEPQLQAEQQPPNPRRKAPSASSSLTMPASDYTSTISGGLKLKGGAKDAGVKKKSKKSKSSSSKDKAPKPSTLQEGEEAEGSDSKTPNADLALSTTHSDRDATPSEQQPSSSGTGKTEAQRRHEEIKRKRLDDRLKREGGAKTHKQRVEELNKYLSTLSEHHDMPRIGPG